MIEKILNKFDFSNPKTDLEVIVGLIIIWALLVGATLHSIYTQKIPMRKKIFWWIIVLCLPLIGVLIYLPFSLKDELFPIIGFWREPKR